MPTLSRIFKKPVVTSAGIEESIARLGLIRANLDQRQTATFQSQSVYLAKHITSINKALAHKSPALNYLGEPIFKYYGKLTETPYSLVKDPLEQIVPIPAHLISYGVLNLESNKRINSKAPSTAFRRLMLVSDEEDLTPLFVLSNLGTPQPYTSPNILYSEIALYTLALGLNLTQGETYLDIQRTISNKFVGLNAPVAANIALSYGHAALKLSSILR